MSQWHTNIWISNDGGWRGLRLAIIVGSMTRTVTGTSPASLTAVSTAAGEGYYRLLFDSIDEGFCVIEKVDTPPGAPSDFRYVSANPAVAAQTGVGDVVGKTIREAFPAEPQEWYDTYDAIVATGKPMRFERGLVSHGRVLELYAFRVDDRSRQVAVLFADITARRRAEGERERLLAVAETARRDAEAANRAKSEFLAVMSHELRTPLNAIDGYAELMELGIYGSLTEGQRAALARIRVSQRHLLGLINGVLNYSRIEAGAVRYAVEAVPIDETLAACEALTAPQARARGLTLHVARCDPALALRGDREKVQQIVLNLISNAVKFTDPGGRVDVGCTMHDGGATITVADTGRGIASHRVEQVFEPFVQVDSSHTRTQDGVGLGLAISRDLARGMGGDITVESSLGMGSIFRLTLPAV